MDTSSITLPAWAKFAAHQPEGYAPRIEVDANAMYPAILAELAARNERRNPNDFPGGLTIGRGPNKGKRVEKMTEADAVCDPARPTQYWLEVAYQIMKMKLQVAMGDFGFDIRVIDNETRKYALAKHPEGRGAHAATEGHEARTHFRHMHGFVPS